MFENITPKPECINKADDGSDDNKVKHALFEWCKAEKRGEESCHTNTYEIKLL